MASTGFEPDVRVRVNDYRIGCIGAGMIMAECHLAAYAQAGFPVVAIASRTKSNAAKVADRWHIPTVHDTPEQLIEDDRVEIVDLAFPPDQQPALIRHALKQKHVKAILAQKPLALSVEEAMRLRDEAAASGKILSVNQNMRYDQSMRVLKQIIDSGALGEIVFAEIDMHAIPHWQTFLADYDRLTLANMSVHHLDVLRFLFGDPDEITTLTRKDPRTKFDHSDGITVSTLRFPSGVLAVSLEDVWSGPRQEGYDDDQHINWRVDGTKGVAKGTIGWPKGVASTLIYASTETTGGKWVSPSWETMWFPHAFIGVMEQLQYALKTGTPPALSVADNVKTMALVEAGYRSMAEGRTVRLSEIRVD
ncbi:Gfo/Idh/MocA family oxidoreductase [Mesorhizobium sp. M2D.F.Ca.ET.185.01.1.1]|uniref:Gfo/Idh/MocA family protein n=1 Tax=unclassified Mesorhizobium TaxID=325217 RepID=UPI000FCC0DDD|nr:MULTISPECIES: Gfo/Idh/MocA family oxidoreductase [unclassified Mesorhizobium]TGP80530.1 Gfo/Idh/MocA family oxidoreductase [bacterium M00.F.Ca.ET.227.01.1.1]TGQ00501.1 Gfo/Idh/MocA family oxidoreductase [bacterium M00.F.Ca.ET.221.01.1.1]TGQ02975.1 Gfo/Idh/MocA family oxidoreductase [bacterium M00.F.Ca.ET.222.01.1.1]TGU09368.1 Gfo/Idh/MocA family oxidoreductase [bacterium M00.F.Ca.ET.163.01.1.1]TGU32605.1 Gfo/Idh/MocA family oxidoreductase [bacterium M00.F.Ca.ET.156.01.1.1]TGU43968.1 Gfo/Id